MITPAQLKQACEELRDELTEQRVSPLVDPFGLDILANRPVMLAMLCDKLNKDQTNDQS
jgi:hypothetical protein